MNSLKKCVILLVFSLILSGLNAQIEMSAEYRPRLEINNGFGNVPTIDMDASVYISQRARLNFDYVKERNRFFFSIQDVRFWGDDNVATATGAWANTHSLGVFQVWAEFGLFNHSRIKIGRQEFKYDDQRLLATRNWSQYGVTYDALLFGYKRSGWEMDLALSYNNDQERGAAGFGNNHFNVDPIARRIRTLNFIYFKKQFNPSFYLSSTAIVSGYQQNKNSNTLYLMATYGLHGSYQGKLLDMQANIYKQGGKNQQGKSIDAYFYTFDAAFKLGGLRPGFGIDIISGNDPANPTLSDPNTDHAFNLLYGAGYMRYGFMNQYLTPASTLGGGWIDVYPQLHVQLDKKNRLTADYHWFFLHKSAADPTRQGQFLSGSLGSELDLVWHHRFSSEISTTLGFSYYFTNETFSRIKRIEPSQIGKPFYAYFMLTYKPVLFKSTR